MIAVSVVLCLSLSGEMWSLDSRRRLEWMMHVAGLCLVLPVAFAESVLRVLAIVRFWTARNATDANPGTRNAHARRMLRYASSVYEHGRDLGGSERGRA